MLRPRIFVAAPAVVIRQLSAPLPEDVEVIGAASWEDAVQLLPGAAPHLIIVCYIFDEMRPYRFIQHVKGTKYAQAPIFLVRAVTVPLGSALESDMRRSYTDLGVSAFLNFSDLANDRGLDAALQEFRRIAVSFLPTAAKQEESASGRRQH
jgi:CheY-like chemotaxis protein